MKPLSILLALMPLAVPAFLAADETSEPKLAYTLKVGEKTFDVKEGVAFQIDGAQAVLKAAPTRTYKMRKMEFEYPTYFTFEAGLSDANSKTWTMSGDDTSVYSMAIRGNVSRQKLARMLKTQFGDVPVKLTETKLNLGGKELDASRVMVTIAGNILTQEVVEIGGLDGWARFIVVQDILDEKRKHSATYGKVLALLKTSFKVLK